MRAASPALLAALAARAPMWSADLFTVSLPDGVTYYWTSADQDIAYDGHVFSALGPSLTRTSWGAKNTTEIPEMVISVLSNGKDFANGTINLKFALHSGLFDGAYILLQRAFMPTFGDTATLGAVTLFGGGVGSIEITSLGAKITVTASNVLLTQNMPRRTFQASCMHTLYDSGCKLDRPSHTDTYEVAAANQLAIRWAGAGPADPSIYLYGTMTLITGAGAGQAITVSSYYSTGVQFGYPLLTVPEPGDTFTVCQGCNKTVARCQSFGNILNFGGFPYVPATSLGL